MEALITKVTIHLHSLNTIIYKFKVSSEIRDTLLPITPVKAKSMHTHHAVAQCIHYHSKREEREPSEEIPDQRQQGKLQSCICIADAKVFLSDLKMFFGSCFADWNTLLSSGLQLSLSGIYGCGTSNILETPKQPRPRLHSLTQWPRWASTQEVPCHTPGLGGFPQTW